VSPSPTLFVPPCKNILQYTADFIFKEHADKAPDFSNLIIFLPHSQVTQQFNNILCHSTNPDSFNNAPPAIIPPWAGTLKNWLNKNFSNEYADYNVISEYSRQLLFIEALQQYPDLFKAENQWQVTQALLNLFDELNLNQITAFSSAEEWQQQLEEAYGIDEQHREIQHLHNESKIVYTLWHAWQQQLTEVKVYDECSDYLSRLKQASKILSTAHNTQPLIINQEILNHSFICISPSHYSQAEQSFIQQLTNNDQCQVIEFKNTLQQYGVGSVAEDRPVTKLAFPAFINETFKQASQSEDQLPIKQRAEKFATEYPELATDKPPFSIYLASNDEQQIRAIDYYVRLNLLNGKNNIGIISEDRKLSRRLRALLERSNVPLQDNAGWSLATTQAATIIERWLECIEEDFSAYPLLDCLKSPFIDITKLILGDDATDEDFKKNIYRFEHDLIFHENVSRNINHYKSQLHDRLSRLTHWPENAYDGLIRTLDYMQQCAAPLQKYYIASTNTTGDTVKLADFLDAVMCSLQQLGVFQCYQNDDAGQVLLKLFDELKQSVAFSNPALSWGDCRTWLGMALESKNFTPVTENTVVQLMTLEQSSHLTFDCLIIAAAESQHYPGSANTSPFFNQAVRASLELPTWEQQSVQRHETFNRALLSAPEVLLTACNEEKGEEKPVSPWLELLISFYNLALENRPDFKPLQNDALQQFVQLNYEVHNTEDKSIDGTAANELPDVSKQPSPALPVNLMAERFSASSYQRLINCPYQYFSADGLQLKPVEELSDELKKSDYGERIHTILQTFHSGHKKYGKAFVQDISDNNRTEAEEYLLSLSEEVFLSDLADNVLHRSWLFRWKKHIPAYISWQIKNQKDWSIFRSEEVIETTLSAADDSVTIYGRLDRIDINQSDGSHAIIDYKTGNSASQKDVDSGENVQLSIYALLDDLASDVSYLSVDSSNQTVATRSSLSGDALLKNRVKNKSRLIEVSRQIKNGEFLPAWGDNTVCQYCNFTGLCRKATWTEN
jgi:ATP-dependent helicase/nuclease subunit B